MLCNHLLFSVYFCFRQIAERRKLVSSIRNSVSNPEEEDATRKEKLSSTNGATSSDHSNTAGLTYSNDVLPTSHALQKENASETKIPTNTKVFGGAANESSSKSFYNKAPSEAASPSQVKIGNSKRLQSENIPAFLLNPASALTSMSETDSEKNSTKNRVIAEGKSYEPVIPVHEDEKPPLAGPNVMNVILVAAECAPWSKTGT